MIYLPTYRAAKILIFMLTKVFRIDVVYYKLFASLFQLTGSLLFNFGVMPTLKVIFNVFIAIYNRSNYQTLSRLLGQLNLNSAITSKVLEVLYPYWNYCMKNPGTFKRLYHIYVTSVLLSTFKISFTFLVRFFISGVLMSFGIVWNEFLSSFSLLSNVAYFIIDNVSSVVRNIYLTLTPLNDLLHIEGSPSPSPTTVNTTNISTGNTNIPTGNGWLTLMVITVAGLAGIVGLAMIGDNISYTKEIVRAIPYASDTLDSVYGFIKSISQWFYSSTPDVAPTTTDNLPYQPRIPKYRNRGISIAPVLPVNRSSSGSSSGSSTATQDSIPTPPLTRTPTPNIADLPSTTSEGVFNSDTWL